LYNPYGRREGTPDLYVGGGDHQRDRLVPFPPAHGEFLNPFLIQLYNTFPKTFPQKVRLVPFPQPGIPLYSDPDTARMSNLFFPLRLRAA
jgi:hypothetical protein